MKQPFEFSGFALMGLLFLTISMLFIFPDKISVDQTNVIRLYGGIAIAILGLLTAYFDKSILSAVLFIFTGVTYVMAAELSLTTTSTLPILIIGIAFIIFAAVLFMDEERSIILTLIPLLTGLNLVVRFFLDTGDNTTGIISGILCMLAALLSYYVCFTKTNDKLSMF